MQPRADRDISVSLLQEPVRLQFNHSLYCVFPDRGDESMHIPPVSVRELEVLFGAFRLNKTPGSARGR